MSDITREWLEEEQAKCKKGFAPLSEATDYTIAVISAHTGYPALLRWALEALERERRLREALAALCDWHTWPEVAGVFGLAAAHGVTVAPQLSEKAQAIWAQAKALLAEASDDER